MLRGFAARLGNWTKYQALDKSIALASGALPWQMVSHSQGELTRDGHAGCLGYKQLILTWRIEHPSTQEFFRWWVWFVGRFVNHRFNSVKKKKKNMNLLVLFGILLRFICKAFLSKPTHRRHGIAQHGKARWQHLEGKRGFFLVVSNPRRFLNRRTHPAPTLSQP